jgi:hypothetical protein
MPHGLASRTIGQGKKRFLLSNELAGAPLVGADIGRRTRWRTWRNGSPKIQHRIRRN